jgi:choline dehydrogenase
MQGVGANLQDYYKIPIVSRLLGDFPLVKNYIFGKPGDPCLEDWSQQRGPYLLNRLPISMVIKSIKSDKDPDLFIFGGPALFRGYYPGYSGLITLDKKYFIWAVLQAHTYN